MSTSRVAESLVVQRLRTISRAWRRLVAEQAEELGITVSQLSVLWSLWQDDGVLTSKLIEGTNLDGGTITGVIDRLEAKGLVRRERDAEDRRVVRVFLTAAGRKLETPLRRIVSETEERALDGLTAVEVQRLTRMLDRVGDNLGAE
jgi:DNA-binding MarR family transcriptional regulator